MSRFPPTHSDESQPDCPPHWSSGSMLELGILLGSIRNEQSRQTEISLAHLDEIRELPERLAAKLSREERQQMSTLLELGTKAFELFKELLPLLAIVGAWLARYFGLDFGLVGH
jgi:hypothetical protein